MSHTNQTPNYNLPQFIGTDKPAWLVAFNQAMSDIDTQMKANATAGATAEADAQSALSGVSALNSQVGGLQTDVTAIQTQLPLDEAQIATNAQNISTQASAIVNANNRIDTANGNITALDTKVGDLADLDTTDKTSIVNAVNEVNAKIPNGYTEILSETATGTYTVNIAGKTEFIYGRKNPTGTLNSYNYGHISMFNLSNGLEIAVSGSVVADLNITGDVMTVTLTTLSSGTFVVLAR